MPLTETAIKKAKPGPCATKLSDGKGLYLLVTTGGSKLWRWKYRTDGKEKVIALGSYPDVTLAHQFRHAMRAAAGSADTVAYSSQAEDAVTRTWRQQRRIEETIGEDLQRPSGMRQRTHERLLDRLEACQQKRDAAFCVAAAGLLRRIGVRDLVP